MSAVREHRESDSAPSTDSTPLSPFHVGDRVRLRHLSSWPEGRVTGFDESGHVLVLWSNGMIEVAQEAQLKCLSTLQ